MIMTSFLLAIMMMGGLFLLLWAGIAFIQNKRFFSTAPREVMEVLEDKRERFKGQHILGYTMAVVAILLMIGSIVLGAMDGIRNGFTLHQFYYRFLITVLLTKAFDIIFFDWILLCNRGFRFFERYYPEVSNELSPKLFGYNKKEHLFHIIGAGIGSFILAWICTLF